jgi:hypothetical protein
MCFFIHRLLPNGIRPSGLLPFRTSKMKRPDFRGILKTVNSFSGVEGLLHYTVVQIPFKF